MPPFIEPLWRLCKRLKLSYTMLRENTHSNLPLEGPERAAGEEAVELLTRECNDLQYVENAMTADAQEIRQFIAIITETVENLEAVRDKTRTKRITAEEALYHAKSNFSIRRHLPAEIIRHIFELSVDEPIGHNGANHVRNLCATSCRFREIALGTYLLWRSRRVFTVYEFDSILDTLQERLEEMERAGPRETILCVKNHEVETWRQARFWSVVGQRERPIDHLVVGLHNSEDPRLITGGVLSLSLPWEHIFEEEENSPPAIYDMATDRPNLVTLHIQCAYHYLPVFHATCPVHHTLSTLYLESLTIRPPEWLIIVNGMPALTAIILARVTIRPPKDVPSFQHVQRLNLSDSETFYAAAICPLLHTLSVISDELIDAPAFLDRSNIKPGAITLDLRGHGEGFPKWRWRWEHIGRLVLQKFEKDVYGYEIFCGEFTHLTEVICHDEKVRLKQVNGLLKAPDDRPLSVTWVGGWGKFWARTIFCPGFRKMQVTYDPFPPFSIHDTNPEGFGPLYDCLLR